MSRTRTILLVIGGAVALIALVVGGYALKYATADVRGKVAQNEAVKADPNYRIASYDAFYDACGAIQAKEDAIDAQLALQDAYEKGSPDFVRIETNLVALRAARASLIRAYNADASKADTRANFHASDLPYSIDPTQEHTTCAR